MNITGKEYLDKVHGGWFGKCLGGAAGAPVEGFKKIIEHEHYRETFRTDLPNDDLDLQLLWLEVLEKKGFGIKAKDLAKAWEEQCWYPFSEYGVFLKNYERGIMPPFSGSFNNPFFCEGEGSPIRSEIWGMCFPGRPEIAAYYAEMDSSLDHANESLWIEQYYAAIEADAFFESDIEVLFKKHLVWLPEESRARQCALLILSDYESGDKTWEKARTSLMRRFAHFDFTNGITNLGLVMIALLYGNQDMDTIVNIAYRCGYDADCTCATAGAIHGIIIGYDGVDESLKKLVTDRFVIGIDVKRTNNSIKELAKETVDLGLKIEGIDPRNLRENLSNVEIEIVYLKQPSIGLLDRCSIEIRLTNHLEKAITQKLEIQGLPNGFEVEGEEIITLLSNESRSIKRTIETTESVNCVENTNIFTVKYGEYEEPFGVAGAMLYKAVGPYFEQLEKEDPAGLPSPHGADCQLPTLECMVNNAVYLEKEYLQERDVEDGIIINAHEDILPLNETFTFRGQGCIYLEQTLISPEDREVWFVISNNDGFKYWVNEELIMEKDEIRLCTPYNNYGLLKLKKGKNNIKIKILKRTDSFQFGIAYRKYEGEHFHRKRWYTDFKTCIL